ncbi:hypothetical protein SJI00_13345 [Pseudomonas sp. RP23018S]|uniref:DUF7256 domain-containing protein n=1 Tax=Pseudomonas sp. RP23018S TaxID=3096037 RepID=UPI002ACAD681|nr:hypothetical protein [Pseudomonas sp. RP23018S]MDZ5603762.1 hypothetical protein [Pseudomonas sp. RP23018S]
MKPSTLATLRPSLPIDGLPGSLRTLAAQADADGYLPDTYKQGVRIRLERGGTVGSVRFFSPFACEQTIERLHLSMPYTAAIAAQPRLEPLPPSDEHRPEERQCQMVTDEGHELRVTFRDDLIQALQISLPNAVYPAPPKLLADPSLTVAYDLLRDAQRMQPNAQRGTEWAGGWSLGLPPGLRASQWPMSESLGHPLRHAFTLHVPPQYRTQGEALVALSVFVDDQFEELPSCDAVEAFFTAPLSETPPGDPALRVLWQHARDRHPGRFDMQDILGTRYAVLWLTQAEFDGALCAPPRLPASSLLGPEPAWLTQPYPTYFYDMRVREPGQPPVALLADAGLETALPIRAQVREGDPNVGKPPREWEHECVDSGYVPAFSEQAEGLDLERFFGRNHLGGTMMPEQGYPDFGPRYLGCEEDFGGFNFGGGTAQFDLASMQVDWACG